MWQDYCSPILSSAGIISRGCVRNGALKEYLGLGLQNTSAILNPAPVTFLAWQKFDLNKFGGAPYCNSCCILTTHRGCFLSGRKTL